MGTSLCGGGSGGRRRRSRASDRWLGDTAERSGAYTDFTRGDAAREHDVSLVPERMIEGQFSLEYDEIVLGVVWLVEWGCRSEIF